MQKFELQFSALFLKKLVGCCSAFCQWVLIQLQKSYLLTAQMQIQNRIEFIIINFTYLLGYNLMPLASLQIC